MKFDEVKIGMTVCMNDVAFADDFSSGYGIVTRIYDDKIKVVSVNPVVESWTGPTHHIVSVDDIHHVDFSPEHVSGCYALRDLSRMIQKLAVRLRRSLASAITRLRQKAL